MPKSSKTSSKQAKNHEHDQNVNFDVNGDSNSISDLNEVDSSISDLNEVDSSISDPNGDSNSISDPNENENEFTDIDDIKEILSKNFTPPELAIIKEIGYSIGQVGMPVTDARKLANLSNIKLEAWRERVPELDEYFALEDIRYKYKLLEIVNGQAIANKDVRLATKLLEMKYSEEYNPAVKKETMKQNQGAQEDVMTLAIALIRQNAAHEVPINATAGLPEDRSIEKVKYREVKEVLK